jgi:hypothetical protein
MRLWRCIGAARNRVRWTFFNFIATIDVPVPDDLMFAAGVDRSGPYLPPHDEKPARDLA